MGGGLPLKQEVEVQILLPELHTRFAAATMDSARYANGKAAKLKPW